MATMDLAKTWGEWLKRRRVYVRILNQYELTRLVGCRYEQVSRWCNSENPAPMRCGYDASLARALKIDREMLLTGWKGIAPEAVQILGEGRPRGADSMRRKIMAVAELLPADKLREFFNHGQRLLVGLPSPAA